MLTAIYAGGVLGLVLGSFFKKWLSDRQLLLAFMVISVFGAVLTLCLSIEGACVGLFLCQLAALVLMELPTPFFIDICSE